MILKIYLFIILLLPLNTFSQTDLPKNADGLYELTGVVNVDSASADNLYSNAKKFVAINFKSGKSVTQLNDDNSKTVVGKGIMTVTVNVGFGSKVPTEVEYTFTIESKDNKYRYSINHFRFYNTIITTIALEDESYWLKKKIARKMWPLVKEQIKNEMISLIELLQKSMVQKVW